MLFLGNSNNRYGEHLLCVTFWAEQFYIHDLFLFSKFSCIVSVAAPILQMVKERLREDRENVQMYCVLWCSLTRQGFLPSNVQTRNQPAENLGGKHLPHATVL